MAAAIQCELELARGDLGAAEAALTRIALPEEVPDSSLFQLALYARGRLRAARGQAGPALADLLLCGRRELALGGITPSAMAWRSYAALQHAALGERDAALALAEEEVELARRLGTPRALGVSLRAYGLVTGELAALQEAAETIEHSNARLEHAQTLCELGAALRRTNNGAMPASPCDARSRWRANVVASPSPSALAPSSRGSLPPA